MGKKSKTEASSIEDHVSEIKKFYKDFEDLNDQPLLMLAAYGLVEWAKNGDLNEKTRKSFSEFLKKSI